jgi:adenylate kinase family enzyme
VKAKHPIKHLPRRFALIGLPGSGKSTFAVKLGKLLQIPVHHLDRHRFEPNKKKRDKQDFLLLQQAMINEDSWIIEGCSFSTFEMRFAHADVGIYFFLPRYLCFWRMVKRLFNYEKSFGGLRQITWELLKYTWNFDKEKRNRIEELVKQYPALDFRIFRSQHDADQYLESIAALKKNK